MNKPEQFDTVIAINVDIQNDFCPGGALEVTDGDQVISPMNKVNRWVRDQKGAVIFTADWHPEDTAHFDTNGGPWRPHCIRHKAGAAFHDELEIGDRDTIAHKGTGKDDDGYSGWRARLTAESPLYQPEMSRTDVGVYVVSQVIDVKTDRWREKYQKRVAMIVGGLATDYCVKATVLDALKPDTGRFSTNPLLDVYVVLDGIRAVDMQPGDGDRAIAEMKAAGATFVSSEAIVAGKVLQTGVRHER
jgi:nicotinamidase/pyrazinamidase